MESDAVHRELAKQLVTSLKRSVHRSADRDTYLQIIVARLGTTFSEEQLSHLTDDVLEQERWLIEYPQEPPQPGDPDEFTQRLHLYGAVIEDWLELKAETPAASSLSAGEKVKVTPRLCRASKGSRTFF